MMKSSGEGNGENLVEAGQEFGPQRDETETDADNALEGDEVEDKAESSPGAELSAGELASDNDSSTPVALETTTPLSTEQGSTTHLVDQNADGQENAVVAEEETSESLSVLANEKHLNPRDTVEELRGAAIVDELELDSSYSTTQTAEELETKEALKLGSHVLKDVTTDTSIKEEDATDAPSVGQSGEQADADEKIRAASPDEAIAFAAASVKAGAESSSSSQPGAFSVASMHPSEASETTGPATSSHQQGEGTSIDPQKVAAPPQINVATVPPAAEQQESNNQDEKNSHRQSNSEPEQQQQVPIVAAEPYGQSLLSAAQQEEVPMIEAELVQPPVQAVQVIYDEHPEANDIDPEQQANPRTPGRQAPAPFEMELHAANEVASKSFFRPRLVLGLCFLAVLLGIAIPVSIVVAGSHSEDISIDMDSAETSGTVAPTFPYKCFTSTADLVQAQFEYPEQNLFIICPQTHIQMGILSNPTAGDTRIVNGDLPLMIVRENVEVRCGLDGFVENNCVFDGGFLQVLFQPTLPGDNSHWIGSKDFTSGRTDNVTIRGITFTGQLVSDYTLGGSSMVISNPGHNVQVVDCKWENLTAPSGLIFLGTNPYQMFSDEEGLGVHDAGVSIINTTFRNITYDGTLLESNSQVLSLQGCKFQDIRLSSYPTHCGDWHLNGLCQSLLYCLYGSICTLEDICVSNFEYAGNASIMVAHTDAYPTFSGSKFLDNVKLHSVSDGYDVCDSGFAWLDNETDEFDCMGKEELGNWTTSDTCTL